MTSKTDTLPVLEIDHSGDVSEFYACRDSRLVYRNMVVRFAYGFSQTTHSFLHTVTINSRAKDLALSDKTPGVGERTRREAHISEGDVRLCFRLVETEEGGHRFSMIAS